MALMMPMLTWYMATMTTITIIMPVQDDANPRDRRLTGPCLRAALSPYFRMVVGIELDDALVEAANDNLAANGVLNARVVCRASGQYCSEVLWIPQLVRRSTQCALKWDRWIPSPLMHNIL